MKMALQLILGSCGCGKSHRMYEQLIKASMEHPQQNYMVIVPEQYTMQTQKNIVSMHPRHGVMNIDILSFGRLAFRVFEELGRNDARVLEDTGKRMVIRKVLEQKRRELHVFGGSIPKTGFSGEIKSMISELLQYNVSVDQLAACAEQLPDHSVLGEKLRDLTVIYEGFKEYIEGHFLTAEEILTRLSPLIRDSAQVRDSYIYLDNFTGFTPAQYGVLAQLLTYSKGVKMTLTVDIRANPYHIYNNYELFYLTKETIYRLEKLCREIHCERKEDLLLEGGAKGRFEGRPELFHLEHNLYRKGPKPYEGPMERISLNCAKNPGEETRYIARTIRRLVRDQGYRYRDIAVICADVAGYRHMVERAFSRMDIPCFIDMKRSILSNAFVECLRAVLEMFADHFSYESVFRYLRSGFSGIPQEDIDLMENYVLEFGIRGASAWKNTWMKRSKHMDDARLLMVNQIREGAFEEIWPVHEVFSNRESTVRQRTDGLIQWIYRMDIKAKLEDMSRAFDRKGELSMAREYGQVYDVVMDLLEKYEDILGDEKISMREYAQILDAGLNEERLGLIPPGMDQVMVGDIERTRLDHVKVLFFMGMNEGIVPAPAKDGGLICDREKEQLLNMHVELAPTARQKGYFEQFYIYTVLSSAGDRIYLSYSQVGAGGKSLRPSSLLRRITRIFPKLTVQMWEETGDWQEWVDDQSEAFTHLVDGLNQLHEQAPKAPWMELYSWFLKQPEYKKLVDQVLDAAFISYISTPLSKAAVRALYGNRLENSVTTLENYSACAYAHFLQYGLCLSRREENKIQTPDLGIILHRALELFAAGLKARNYTWRDVPEDVREELSRDCAMEAAKGFNHTILLETKRNQYQIQRLVRYVLRTTWAIKQQLGRGDFLPEAFELRFDSDALKDFSDIMIGNDGMMKLKGTIDRIDVCQAGDNLYVKIVDYKSGSQKFDIVELYYGLSLQLVVYMNAARALEEKTHPGKRVIPAGILYYNIDDPMIERDDFENMDNENVREEVMEDVLLKLKSNGLVNASPEVIRLFDRDFTKDSFVIPVSLTSSGALSKRSQAATTRQFDALGSFAAKKVETLGQEILNGNISINPYIRGNKNACTYCLFRSVCGFDERIRGFSYRRLVGMSGDEAWKAIFQWNEDHEDFNENKDHKEVKGHGSSVDG